MSSDSPKASFHGGSAPPILPATPSTSKGVRHKLGSWFRKSSSRGKKGEVPEPRRVGAETVQEPNPQSTSTTAPETPLFTAEGIDIEQDAADSARKVAGYELAIAVIEIFQPVKGTDFILPNPVGKALEQLTRVLGVLKKMVENKEAWKDLYETLVYHGDQFNKQLVRLKQNNTKPNEDSAILGPLKEYSNALEKLSAKLIFESGLVQQDTKGNPGWEKIKRFATAYISADSEASQVETYRQALRDAMQALSQDLLIYVAFSINQQPGQTAAPRKKIVAKRPPKVSPYYVSRDREWKFMVDSIVDSTTPGQKIVAITGMGGCGKTQLVSYFLKEKENMFTHIVYVDANSTASIETDLRTWVQSLGDGHEQDDWKNALYLLAVGRWVYILDNADEPEVDLPHFIPESTDGTIIITSRNLSLGNLAQYHLQMGEMTEEEALSALIKAARRESPIPADEHKSAVALIKELGCLALAIAHVGAYCYQLSSVAGDKRHVFTFTRYIARFYSNRTALMKEAGPPAIDGYRLGAYTTLDLSYEKLPQSAKDFFRLISNFHYADIPMEMLVAAAETRFCDPKTLIQRDVTSIPRLTALLGADRSACEYQTEAVIQTLRSFSLVSTTFIEDLLFLRIHPLVQAWMRDKSSEGEDYGAMATQVLTSCSIESNVNIYRHLLPHIYERLKGNQASSLQVNDQAALGQVLLEMGNYSTAEALFREVLKSLQKISGEETENTLWIAGHLASTYHAQGKYGEAEKLQLEVVERRGKIFGNDHLETIAAVADLASTYSSQGRYSEAEKLEVEVVEKRRETLSVDHPETIAAVANLASTYGAQGRHSKAEELQLSVLEMRERILGVDHPHTITAAENLAWTYGTQGRHSKAEELQLSILEKERKILGIDHPKTMTAAANLAWTCRAQGRYTQAEELELEVLEKRKKILGVDHPQTITAVANIAWTYRAQGRSGEAEKLQLEALEKRRKVLGVNHPDTITMAASLASTYSIQGRYSEAEKLELEVVEKRQKILGVDHPKTMVAAANLALTYRNQGQYTEAEKLEMEVLEKRQNMLGIDHPDTIEAAANLAWTRRAQRRYDEAEELQLEVVEKWRKILGVDHPHTIIAAANLALIYGDQGRHGEAEKLEIEVLEKLQKILGVNHPDTIYAATNLAWTYRAQGRLEEAEKLGFHNSRKA